MERSLNSMPAASMLGEIKINGDLLMRGECKQSSGYSPESTRLRCASARQAHFRRYQIDDDRFSRGARYWMGEMAEGSRENQRNHFQGCEVFDAQPSVAGRSSRQRWAGGRNTFGVLGKLARTLPPAQANSCNSDGRSFKIGREKRNKPNECF